MNITATIKNNRLENTLVVSTDDQAKTIPVSPKPTGGSSINGGELLLLALATCYCNDIYREALKFNIDISEVTVDVTAIFGAAGEAGTNFEYKPFITSNASREQLKELIEHTDRVAEIQKTLRQGVEIRLVQ